MTNKEFVLKQISKTKTIVHKNIEKKIYTRGEIESIKKL